MATATMMTSAEFLAQPDEFDQSGNRIKEELIGGETVRKAEPSKRHDLTKNDIGDALAFHLRAHRELGLRSSLKSHSRSPGTIRSDPTCRSSERSVSPKKAASSKAHRRSPSK